MAYETPTSAVAVTSKHQARILRNTHAGLTLVWLAMVPIALVTGWVESIVFVSACSIYANAIAHFSAYQGSRAEKANGDAS